MAPAAPLKKLDTTRPLECTAEKAKQLVAPPVACTEEKAKSVACLEEQNTPKATKSKPEDEKRGQDTKGFGPEGEGCNN